MLPSSPSGSVLAERLDRDAERVREKDIERLEESVPKKLAGMDLREVDEKVTWIGGLVRQVRLLFEMLRDPDFKVGGKVKAMVAAGLLYFVLPTDLTPDFIPGVGYLDDALVLNILWKSITDQIDRFTVYRNAKQGADA